MEKASKADFKEAMRRAKIKEEVENDMENIIGDSAAAYFATDSQVDIDEPRKPGRPKKTKVQSAEPKKRGRKPKTEPKTKDTPKEPVAAGQEEEAKQEALKGLVEIADRWINGRKVDADRYKKISEDIDAQVKQYQGYIDTVKEMIQ
jgi:hypothetical protein